MTLTLTVPELREMIATAPHGGQETAGDVLSVARAVGVVVARHGHRQALAVLDALREQVLESAPREAAEDPG